MTTLIVMKSSDETRTSNTALADSELSLTLAPNTTYRIRGQVVYCAAAPCDFRFGLSSGSGIVGAALITFGEDPATSLSDISNSNERSAIFLLDDLQVGRGKPFIGLGDSTTYTTYTMTLPISGVVTTGADGVTLSVVWGQWTLDATNPARVLAGSCLIAEPIPANTKRQIVIKQLDENRDDPAAGYAPDAELVGFQLEANSVYHIEFAAPCYSKATFATNVYGILVTDIDLLDRSLRTLRHTTASLTSVSTQPARGQVVGAVSAGTIHGWPVFNNIGDNTSYRGMMYCCGVLETGETAGELWFEWRKVNNGGEYGPNVTVFKDAFLVVEKISECGFNPL